MNYVIELTDNQRQAIIASLDERARGCLDRIRESIANDILTMDEVREQVRVELEWLHSTIDVLGLMSPDLATRREMQLESLIPIGGGMSS